MGRVTIGELLAMQASAILLKQPNVEERSQEAVVGCKTSLCREGEPQKSWANLSSAWSSEVLEGGSCWMCTSVPLLFAK